jgi:hypothetical protein
MDKLELDTRVARLERRVSLLTTVLILAAAGAVITIYFARIGVSEAAATVVGPPVMTPARVAPPPAEPFAAFLAPGMPSGGMGGMYAEGTMEALHHQLSTLKQLLDENIIDEGEWRAKRSKVLAEPLKPGDLRLDLGMVKELHDGKVICDDEQADLRARLLGIGKKHKK